MFLPRQGQSDEEFKPSTLHIPSWGQTRWLHLLIATLTLQTSILFEVYLVPCVFALSFVLVVLLLKMKEFWMLWEKARVGWFERTALKHEYYHTWNRLPVQVPCMRQGAQGWCTGMTLRDGMGWEVGGRVRMGNTCTPMADSCECIAKKHHNIEE